MPTIPWAIAALVFGGFPMSWNFSGIGTNQSTAKADFLQQLTANTSIPAERKVHISYAAGALSTGFAEEQVTRITTGGHLNPDGSGNVMVSVNY